jgi:predicted nucleotide-binding protein
LDEAIRPAVLIVAAQASRGKTIIEKLEHYGNVDFAVVLLTPDDEGRAINSPDRQLRPRARQNVVLELGFFVGLLGREHVCALHKESLEVPSDFDGVVWVPMDALRGWQAVLGRELAAAGFTIDMNKAL